MAQDFLDKVTSLIEKNISNELFGVSELADELGMSRSNLLRKVKKATDTSVSQLIRQIRLRHGLKLLNETSLTVSEVSFKVGFSSVSYFVKCFHDHYGYPPGEINKVDHQKQEEVQLPQSHKLVAIMFTDIQGYTALMQADEKKAIGYRNRHRNVFNSVTKKFNGKILQYYGDGTLSIFSSVIDAVRCGIEMQLAFQKDPMIPVRIGIHSGDIIVTNEDIIGDGVNVASRIESLATAGSIFISEKAYDEVKNQADIHAKSMGAFDLKNVGKPMEVYAITNQGLNVPHQDQIKSVSDKASPVKKKKKTYQLILVATTFILLTGSYLLNRYDFFSSVDHLNAIDPTKKSIAVLPFINDSNDSSNVYIINGLMESILNNLQTINDLRVTSRTSVEKYRYSSKLIPEIGEELSVRYLVEGSGQKIGDQIFLSIQLIDASRDSHLWAGQYERSTADIFGLQREVAKNIAEEIEAIITPQESERIEKIPTENLEAYDYFLRGLDLINNPNPSNFDSSLFYFSKAIELDNQFARAYAARSIAYYHLDEYQEEKKYTEQINYNADQALLYDDQLPQSLIAKALYYLTVQDYDLAVSFLEKSLDYNPNYGLAYIYLIDLYANQIPNTEKYLEYALKGLEIEVGTYDSMTTSFMYLHISNAFIQNGFVDEAIKYVDRSLDYAPENLFSQYTRAFILYGKNGDLEQTRDLLLETFAKDSTRLDVMQEVAKVYYFLRDYEKSYIYYKEYLEIKNLYQLDIYPGEYAKIGFVYDKMGFDEEARSHFEKHKKFMESNRSIYRYLSAAVFHSYHANTEMALNSLRSFSEQEDYFYWVLLFLEIDPLLDNIRDLPEFRNIMEDLNTKFWANHKRFRIQLEDKGVI